ncbi:nucleolar protein NOP2 [Ascosphaera apis ARSEF 7405]|uniref:Nucleolar protein NOP2 n=1 Tax=Ascosphaera apis ARSEF 7405 TaxID=392613 RepID=A0A168AIC9_9EURO|nr:nucleolar protein NOP2 [Ascosphaera apis ARSEF 7405]
MAFFLPAEGVSGSLANTTNVLKKPLDEDVNAHIARETVKFRTMSRNIPQPMSLTGISDYMEWKEEIELAAKTAGILEILQKQNTKPASREHMHLWNECNMWLYCLIWHSISDEAKGHIYKGPAPEYSAYVLWKKVEEAFSEKPDVARRRLMKEICQLSQRNDKEKNNTSNGSDSDRAFVLNIIKIRSRLEKIKFPLPDYFYYDLVLNGISPGMQDQLERRLKNPITFTAEMDFGQFLDELLRQLPVD